MARIAPRSVLPILTALVLLPVLLVAAGRAAADTPLDWFVGDWDVRVRAAGEADFPQAVSFEWAVRPALDGRWLAGSVIAEGRVFTHEFQGGGPGALVRQVFAADGSRVRFTSAGWDGAVLVWTGEMITEEGVVPLRETIRRQGDDRAEAVFETGGADGWTLLQTERLVRD